MKEGRSKQSMETVDTTTSQTEESSCDRDTKLVFDNTGTNTEIVTVEVFSTPHATPSFNRNGGSMTWNEHGGVPPLALSSNSLSWDSNGVQLTHGGPVNSILNCGPSESNGGSVNSILNCGPSDSNGVVSESSSLNYNMSISSNPNGVPLSEGGISNSVPLSEGGISNSVPLSEGGISNSVPLSEGGISNGNTYVCINSNGEALIGRDDRESKVVVLNGKIIIKSEREEEDLQDLEDEVPSFIEIKGHDDVDLSLIKSEFPSPDENHPAEKQDSHSRKKYKFDCDTCNKSFISKKGYLNHLASHGDESHECNICKKFYKSEELLKNHIKCHDGMKRFQCEFCDKTYRQSTSLQQHYTVHSGEKTFFCDLCDQTFNYLTNFIRHKRRHEGKTYKCDICDKTFVEQTSIYRHKKLHSGQKEHECDVCGKLFFRAGNMREHRKTHEPREKKEKIFECEQCNKVYPYRSSLRKHYAKKHGESLPDLSENAEWI